MDDTLGPRLPLDVRTPDMWRQRPAIRTPLPQRSLSTTDKAPMDDRPLSPLYLDNEPVDLDDSKPLVAKIIAAGGRKRDRVRIVRLNSRLDMEGSPLGLDDVIDRTEVTPVYLKTIETTPAPESAPGAPGPHLPTPGDPTPPLPPAPMPDRDPSPPPPGPLPPPDPEPQLDDIERARGDQSKGQVE